MRIPIFRRISAADFPDIQGIDQLLIPINLFIQDVTNGLNHDITFDENIACQTKELTFTTASDYIASQTFAFLEFDRKIDFKATGLEIMQITQNEDTFTPIKEATTASWTDTGNGTIRVYFITGLKDSTNYIVRFRVT